MKHRSTLCTHNVVLSTCDERLHLSNRQATPGKRKGAVRNPSTRQTAPGLRRGSSRNFDSQYGSPSDEQETSVGQKERR